MHARCGLAALAAMLAASGRAEVPRVLGLFFSSDENGQFNIGWFVIGVQEVTSMHFSNFGYSRALIAFHSSLRCVLPRALVKLQLAFLSNFAVILRYPVQPEHRKAQASPTVLAGLQC